MPMATFRIDQATPGVGTAGRSRIDLIAGETVTLTATDPAPGPGVTYTWEIVDSAGSAPVLSSTSGTSVTVDQAHLVAPCAGSIKLTANDNGTITSTTRKYAVPGTITGVILPLIGERTTAGQSLGSNTPDDSTDNAVYPDRAGRGLSGQNWRGWTEILHRLASGLETAASKLRGRAVRDVLPTDGQVLTWVDADAWWEPQTPAPGGAGGDGSFIFQPGGTPGDNVYDDFALLYAAASAVANPVVKIDNSAGAAVIPSGSYSFSGWTLKSVGVNAEPLTLADGVAMTVVPYSMTPQVIVFDNLNVATDAGMTASPIRLTAGGVSVLDVVLKDSTLTGDSGTGIGVFELNPGGGGQATLAIKAFGSSSVGELTATTDSTLSGCSVSISAYDTASLSPVAVQDVATTAFNGVNVYKYSDYATVAPDQTSFTGTKINYAVEENTYVFRPGGTAFGNVYTDFTALYAAASLVSGPVVKIDASLALATMAAGTYNFSGWTFKSASPQQATLVLADGVDVEITLGYLPVKFENLQIMSDDSWATSPFHAEPAVDQVVLVVEATDTIFRGDSISNVGMFGFTPSGTGTASIAVTLRGTSQVFTDTIQADDTAGPVNVGIYGYDTSALAEDAVFGTGDITYVQRSVLADMPTQTTLTGVHTYDASSSKKENHVLNGTQTGTAELLIGALYFAEGQVILAGSSAWLGTVGGGTDTADLFLRYTGDGSLIATWTATGPLQSVGVSGAVDVEIAANSWYELYLAAGGAAQVAMARGLQIQTIVRGLAVPE